jgi:hypothetical protein
MPASWESSWSVSDWNRKSEVLKLVAREGHDFKPFSKIMLSIIALREKRPQEPQQWFTELARDYPQNRLFRTGLAKANAKLGINAN